jgi:carbonic anhydrase
MAMGEHREVVGCDSRVAPAIVFECVPGEVLVVRSVAGWRHPGNTPVVTHGTSAAIEFAVKPG